MFGAKILSAKEWRERLFAVERLDLKQTWHRPLEIRGDFNSVQFPSYKFHAGSMH